MTSRIPTAGSSTPAARDVRSGLAATVVTFILWGLFPLYLKALAAVPPGQILAHRIVWCCLLVFVWLVWRGQFSAARSALADPAVRWRLALSALMISVNWLVYVWAVNAGHVIDASLGYFINPLVSVMLGVIVLHERLRRVQTLAIFCAAAGVLYLTIVGGRPPWIALALACSFGLYGLIRKVVRVEAVPGLAVETLMVAPFAIAWLAWSHFRGVGVFGHGDGTTNLLLAGSGLATALPLALFSYGARLIPLSTVGLIQYIGPSLQLLVGITVFAEPFPPERAWGFAVIWAALALYAGDGFLQARRLRQA